MEIRVKRVYEEPEAGDGMRILVDRYWPRGLSREKARVDLWLREISPSDKLRRSFNHDKRGWSKFKSDYSSELDNKRELLNTLAREVKKGTVTLLYSSKEESYNNAVALRDYVMGVKGRMRAGAAA